MPLYLMACATCAAETEILEKYDVAKAGIDCVTCNSGKAHIKIVAPAPFRWAPGSDDRETRMEYAGAVMKDGTEVF